MVTWVKVQLLKKYPDIIAKRGANIGGFKQFKDFDNNGIVGNPKDFKLFYRKYKTTIDKNIPFFKWASIFGGKHPLIEALSIESNIVSATKIKATFTFFEGALAAAKNAKTAKDLFKVLIQKKVRIAIGTDLISEGIASLAKKSGGLTSDAVNLMVMGLAIALKLRKVRLALLPSSTRIKEGKQYYQLTPGGTVDVSKARALGRTYRTPRKIVRQGIYLWGLSLKKTFGQVYNHYGRYELARNNYAAAARFFKRAWRHHRLHVGALRGRGTALFHLGNYAAAEAALSQAIAFDHLDALSYYLRAHIRQAGGAHRKAFRDRIRACRAQTLRKLPATPLMCTPSKTP
jgi:tetratricopeptide (TPR) repeat protein